MKTFLQGRATLEVTVVDEEELPTNITGVVTWEEDSTKEFDWQEYSKEGEKGTISFSFNNTYERSSNYRVAIKMANQVSEVTKYIDVSKIFYLNINLYYLIKY